MCNFVRAGSIFESEQDIELEPNALTTAPFQARIGAQLCNLFYMHVFRPTGQPQEVDSIALPPVTHSKTEKS